MKIIDCVQGSPEWWEARKGIPTASNFDKIMTAKTMKPSAQMDDLICELIADRLRIGPPPESEDYRNAAMMHGLATEPEARRWYEMQQDCDVRQIGFCLTDDGRFGCSPDGLVGEDGGLELKCPAGKTHVGYLLSGGLLPDSYKGQVHGALIVTGRQWWDFASYVAGFPPFLVRVTRSEYTDALAAALEMFAERYARAWQKVEGMR